MTKTKTQKQRRRSEAKRKAADDPPPSDRRMKRKLNHQPESEYKEHQATSGRSEEALFKIRYAAEFDDESVLDSGSHANVKHEQQDVDNTAVELAQFVDPAPSGPQDRTPSLPAIASSQYASSARDGFHQEDVFVAILSQASWDSRMTQMAVDNLARRAQQKATPGHLFDQAYINGLIRLIDTTGVEPERRAQVITMLRASLREPLADWTLRIDRVGIRSPPPTPHTGASRLLEPDSPESGPVPSTSRLLYVDVGRPSMNETARAWCTSSQQSAFRSSSRDSNIEAEDIESQDGVPHSRTLSQHRVSPPLSSTAAPSRAANTTKSTNNLRVYGTQRPKAPFDIFARCVISAWALAPKPGDEPVKIRAYARSSTLR